MTNGLNHVAGSRFPLGTNHGSTFIDSSQGLAQISCAAYERNLEISLVDVVNIIGGGQHFRLIDVVDFDGFQKLRLYKMPDSALRHNRNTDRFLNALDHLRIAHSGYTAGCTNICRNPLQRHYRTRTRFLCNLCLFRCCNVHDDSALQHLSQTLVQFILLIIHC